VALDERLRRELERAGRPADPSGIYEDLIRRRERRRIVRKVEVSALAVAVTLGSIGAFAALTRIFGGSEPPAISDGGLGFAACDVTSVDGAFFPTGEIGTAYVFEPEPEGGCDGPNENFQHIAVVDRGGRLVAMSDELTAGTDAFGFRLVAAPDIDGDGIAELAIDVSDPQTSAMGIDFYRVQIDQETQQPSSFLRLVPDCGNEGCLTPQLDGIGTFTWGVSDSAFSGLDCGGGSIVGWTEPTTPGKEGVYVLWDVQEDDLVERSDVLIDHEPHTEPPTDICGAPVNLEAATMLPIPTPSSEMTTSEVDEDIGLGFPVCDVTSVRGQFTPGVDGRAFVATRTGDTGGCPTADGGMQVLAVDVNGDGVADTSYGPLECDERCSALSAPDVDGDGTDELLVKNVEFSIIGLTLFEVQLGDGGAALGPVTVAPPGDPAGGFEPGAIAQLYLGGDEFYMNTLRCGDLEDPDGPGLVVTAAESLPHDSPKAEWHAHEITFVLRNWELHVVDVGDFTEPVGTTPPSFQSGETLCGSNLGPSQA
jgi:hypothetical protein